MACFGSRGQTTRTTLHASEIASGEQLEYIGAKASPDALATAAMRASTLPRRVLPSSALSSDGGEEDTTLRR